MPVYNNEKYFPMAVESVEKQNYDNYELIVIDDGSTDNTSQIADNLAARNPHIKVIHQENQWIYNSFNNGIALATGEYIYILNSDDKLAPGVFWLFDKKIKEFHPDIIWTNILVQVCDKEQNVLRSEYDSSRYVKKEFFYSNKKEVEKAWPYFYSTRLAISQANLYRREIIQGEKFRNDVYGADTLFNISIADRIYTALVLKEIVYIQYVYQKSNIINTSKKYYSYTHSMYNEIYEKYRFLFQKWKLDTENYEKILCRRRIIGVTSELRGLQAVNCPLSIEEKLQYAFYESIDDIIKECISEEKLREEWESRILSAVKELLVKEAINIDNKMYFVYELLESLLRYEKDDEDFRKIKNAIYHPLNPMHIGETFYKKLLHNEEAR